LPVDREAATSDHGESLLPLLNGEAGEGESARPAYTETYVPRFHFGWQELQGLRYCGYNPSGVAGLGLSQLGTGDRMAARRTFDTLLEQEPGNVSVSLKVESVFQCSADFGH
jgi:hypothetical protein